MKIKTEILGVFLLTCCVLLQSFTKVDCYQQFNRDLYDASVEYEKDLDRCFLAWPPGGYCKSEAVVAYHTSFQKAIDDYDNCVNEKE